MVTTGGSSSTVRTVDNSSALQRSSATVVGRLLILATLRRAKSQLRRSSNDSDTDTHLSNPRNSRAGAVAY